MGLGVWGTLKYPVHCMGLGDQGVNNLQHTKRIQICHVFHYYLKKKSFVGKNAKRVSLAQRKIQEAHVFGNISADLIHCTNVMKELSFPFFPFVSVMP